MIEHAIAGTVGQLMTRDPLTVEEDAPVFDAAELMDTFDITGLPVVDHEGAVVGVVSQVDLVRAASTRHLWSGWPRFTVRHLMTSPAITVSESLPLEDAAALMERERIHRLIVVGADGTTPIGVISMTDLVRLLVENDSD